MPFFEVVHTGGIGFRSSPNLADKATHVKGAKAGEVLEGNHVGNDWFELNTGEGLFLPIRAPDGTTLLREMDRPPSGALQTAGWSAANSSKFGDVLDKRPPSGGGAMIAPAKGGRSDELAAFDKKYDQKYGNRKPIAQTLTPSPFGQMAHSHDANTAYMHEFRDALEDMGVDTRDDPYLQRYAPLGGAVDAVRTPSGALIRPGSRTDSRPNSRPTSKEGTGNRPASRGATGGRRPLGGAARGTTPEVGGGAFAMCGSMVVSRSAHSGTEGRWAEGPQNSIVPVKEWTSVKHGREVQNRCSSGRVIDLSDRNIFCMSILGEKAVLGSGDHGLAEINIRSGQKVRTLYSKTHGHTEWVTTVSHCPDGRIVSGAMDSKVCLWNASGVHCDNLTGHMGGISRVRVDERGKLAISSSYDRTLSVWDLRGKRMMCSCTGHNAPVLDFVWFEQFVASGDRSGLVKLWDTNHATNIGTLKGHKGHITAMCAVPDPSGGSQLVLTGAQDGCLRIWDLRQKLNTLTLQAHPGGAVNDIGITARREVPLCVTTGADGRVLVLEPRSNFRVVHELGPMLTDDFFYSLLVLDQVAFLGVGRGNVLCLDLQTGDIKYTLSGGENAIRCLGACASSLVAAGDDGNAVIFDF